MAHNHVGNAQRGDMYTVVSLYPASLQEDPKGDLTYVAHVRAPSWEEAMLRGVGDAVLAQTGTARRAFGWRPLVCFPGWHDVAGFGWQTRDRHVREGSSE